MTRIVIDDDLCVGAGSCVLAAPDVFDQSDVDGRVVLLSSSPPDERSAAVRDAVEVCPARALALEDDDDHTS